MRGLLFLLLTLAALPLEHALPPLPVPTCSNCTPNEAPGDYCQASNNSCAVLVGSACAAGTTQCTVTKPEKKDDLPIPGWLLGVILNCIGPIFGSLATLLMKHSHNVGESEKPLYYRGLWWLGLGSLFVSVGLDATALAYTSIGLIAAFAGWTICIGCVLASCGFLSIKERIDGVMIGLICLMIVGVSLVAGFGPHPDTKYTVHETMEFFNNWPFHLLSFIMVSAVVGLQGVLFIATKREWPSAKIIHTIAYGVLGAAQGAYSQMFLKIFTTAIRYSVDDGKSQFDDSRVWMCLIGLVAMAVGQLWAMNMSLRGNLYYLSSSVYQSLLVVCPVLVGATFYNELEPLDTMHLFLFFSGQAIVILSLVAIVFIQGKKHEPEALLGEDEPAELSTPGGWDGTARGSYESPPPTEPGSPAITPVKIIDHSHRTDGGDESWHDVPETPS